VNIIFGTHACDLLAVCAEIIAKMYLPSLEAGASGKAISVIFCTFVESGKQHLDCAGAVGMGSEPIVFTRGAYTCAICFSTFV